MVESSAATELQDVCHQSRYNLRSRSGIRPWQDETVMINISVKKGTRDIGIDAIVAIMEELEQLHRKKVFILFILKEC